MSKKWEYHVVEMPFCCCISEVITIDIGAQLPTTIKLDEHYKLDMLQNCRLLLDLVLLLLCCFLYELNLFNDLLFSAPCLHLFLTNACLFSLYFNEIALFSPLFMPLVLLLNLI
ncbi:hypothetical protein T12_7464 [Trichinella patagoniensis]|uniref:Uncharacterized protein n=1 Tax=Trichinella patagoniensis TaxID=990121 RepID=A0A0V1AAT3_9BILA|nr:hypothetical protein T12_7464 [Trichinella patagoniensis]